MSFTRDLLDGYGALLDTAGVGIYDADGTVIIPDNETAITLGRLSQSHPRSVALATYGVDDDPSLSDSTIGLQVRCRGLDDRDVADLADSIFDLIHGAQKTVLSTGVVIVQSLRRIPAVAMGYDPAGRPERADSYYIDCHRPSPHRT